MTVECGCFDLSLLVFVSDLGWETEKHLKYDLALQPLRYVSDFPQEEPKCAPETWTSR